MSGDVQPRKRKDKKKRKDEDSYGSLSSNEDVTIHVHKDGGTGGNICAKIVFFFLFSALIVLVGLIIKENQGLNELDSAEEESRFSQIFEGWVDKNVDEHEDHSPELHGDDQSNEHEDDYHSDEGNIEEDTEEDQSQELDDEQEEDEDSLSKSEEDDSQEVSSSPRSEDDSGIDEDEHEDEQNSPELSEESSDETLHYESDHKEVEKSKEIDDSAEIDDNGSKEIRKIVESASAELDTKHIEEVQDATPETQNEEQPPKESSGHINVGDELESDSDKDDYEHSDVTNKDDVAIKENIDAAQKYLDKNAAYANKMFEALLEQYPLSPRSLYGKARALDILAEENQSNDLLQEALSYYMRALNAPNVPDRLFIIIAERYIDRARFMGQYKQAIAVHWQVIERWPDNSTYLNNLAVTYLTINLVEEAREVLKKVLSKWPNDGFAMVHYGFILKTADNNLKASVEYMSRGLKTKAAGVVDGRFYFHLGDALTRLNRRDEAAKLYEEGVEQKVFLSKYQRSLYNIDRLTAKPWLEPKEIPSYQKLFSALKENWQQIRQEGLSALNQQGYFRDEAENLKDSGTWKQLELFARGQMFSKNCEKTPVTCSIIQRFPAASRCKRGQTKFSVMHPGTHVWPHCGPTNCRLRIHLGLKIPADVFIRVAEETRGWKEGDIIIFDDSFEHEVWHNGTEFRLVLIVDVWHPNLTSTEKKSLSAI